MKGFSTNLQELAADSATAANDQLRQAINSALMEALDNELSQAGTVNELWGIFRDTLRRLQYAVFMDSMTDSMRDELYTKIMDRDYDDLRLEAISKIMEDEEDALMEDAVQRFIDAREDDQDFIAAVEDKLKSEMREEVAEQLRQELLSNPAFIEAVKVDLKRTILGL